MASSAAYTASASLATSSSGQLSTLRGHHAGVDSAPTTSELEVTQGWKDILQCAACKIPFEPVDSSSIASRPSIYTSISCGHSYHSKCLRTGVPKPLYESLNVLPPLSKRIDCRTCSRAILESDSLLVRNIPLERIVLAIATATKTKEMQDTSHIINAKKRPLTGTDVPPPPSQSSTGGNKTARTKSKRVKLSEPIPEEQEEEETVDRLSNGPLPDAYDAEQIISSQPSSPLPDSDPEDENRTLQQLYTASQALAAVPHAAAAPDESMEEAAIDYTRRQGADGMDELQTFNIKESRDTAPPPSQLPLDEYGMPPLSQFRRSLAV